jgi:hypothetical protein
MLTDVYRGFPHFLQSNSGIRLRALPTESFPIHYSSHHPTLYSLDAGSVFK